MNENLTKTPMTEDEKRAALALSHCSFPWRSFDKRFSVSIAVIARENGAITDRQRACLWMLINRYHRQIKDQSLVDMAREKTDGQRSLEFKQQDTIRQKVHRVSRIKHKVTDFFEQELFNGFPEDNF